MSLSFFISLKQENTKSKQMHLIIIAIVVINFVDSQWTNEVMLDNDKKIVLKWFHNDSHVTMRVEAETNGYVGIGFSPTGGMKGADIIFGWVTNNGDVQLYDMFAPATGVPVKDVSQDVYLLGGSERGKVTALEFQRALVTCDTEQDYPLGEDTVRVIWATGEQDPSSIDHIAYLYHGQENRGTRSLYLTSSRDHTPNDNNVRNFKTVDFLLDQIELPSRKTMYWCKIFDAPKLARKHHIVGHIPILQEDTKPYTHHMLLYACYHPEGSEKFEQYVNDKGSECYNDNMPADWLYCGVAIAGWAVGGEGELLPSEAGLPMTEKFGGADYFMLEMHYDNPHERSGIVDSSGIRLFYTAALRAHDAGIIAFGSPVSPFQIIPPKQKLFSNVGVCPRQCTLNTIPEGGILATDVFAHAHLAARAIRLRHFRDGVELPPIMQDNHYDFNYQQNRILPSPVRIYPGDELQAECDMNTEDRSRVTFGGLGTYDEMCLVSITYYPEVDLSFCASVPDFYDVLESLQNQKLAQPYLVQQLYNERYFSQDVLDPTESVTLLESGRNIFQHLNETDWTEGMVNRLQEYTTNRGHTPECLDAVGDLPKYKVPLKVQSPAKGKKMKVKQQPCY